MTKKELKERVDALGPEPIDSAQLVLYLAEKVDILTQYLLEHKTLGGGR